MAEETATKEAVEVSPKIAEVLETIEKLTVLEASELVKALEDRFGVSAAPQAMAMPMAAAMIQNGRYAASAKGGVLVGTHDVEILAFRENSPQGQSAASDSPLMVQYLPEKYNVKTGLSITIPAGSGPLVQDFDLTD